MNAPEVLENSHQLVIQSLEDLPEAEWDITGVSGDWSVKDVLALLTAYEQALVDVINTFLGEKPTAYMLSLFNTPAEFNAEAIKARRYHTAQQVLMEYQDLQVQSTSLLTRIPPETVEQKGAMPWYKSEQSLADVIDAFSTYTRDLCARIVQFREVRKASK
ncbi:MAG TPA: DinB family protein [Ktedonobacteraceae bacterium]|nr:DinB family protein [Ktedonobacteraceae bacterium]